MTMSPSFNQPVADLLSDHAFFDGIYIKTDRFVDPFWDRVLPIMPEEQIFMCRQMKKTIKDLREKKNAGLHVLDIGTGSGVLAIYADHLLNCDNNYLQSQIVALDKSERAMEFAKMNCRLNGCKNVKFLSTQEYSSNSVLPKFQDVILVNPPFNPTYESLDDKVALHARGGKIGTDVLTEWLRYIPLHLHPNGVVIGYHMSPLDTNGEIVVLTKIRDALGNNSTVHYCKIFEEYYKTKEFLLNQYTDYLSMLRQSRKEEINAVETWIKQQAEKYPYLSVIYYEAWKNGGTGKIQNDLAPIWQHGQSWEDRIKIHRFIVNTVQKYPEELTTQRVITEVPVPYFQGASYEFHNKYWELDRTYPDDIAGARKEILNSTILNNVSKYLDNSNLLKIFDFILVDLTPVIPGGKNYKKINEECAIWPGENVSKLSKNNTEILRKIIQEYQTTTVLLQRSRLAPFFHPLFVYPHHFSGWPTGWFSKIKGTIIDKDKYFKKIWNLFKTSENNYLQNQTSKDQIPFVVFDNEFSKGEKPFVYSVARLIDFIEKTTTSCFGINWSQFLVRYEKRKQEFVKNSKESENIFPERDFHSIQYTMHLSIQEKVAEILKKNGHLADISNLFSALFALPLSTGDTEDAVNLARLDVNETLPAEYVGGLWIWAVRLNGESPLSYVSMLKDLSRFIMILLLNFYPKELFKAYKKIGWDEGEKDRAIVSGHEAGAQLATIKKFLPFLCEKNYQSTIAKVIEASLLYVHLFLSENPAKSGIKDLLVTEGQKIEKWVKKLLHESWLIAVAREYSSIVPEEQDLMRISEQLDRMPLVKSICNNLLYKPDDTVSDERDYPHLKFDLTRWVLAALSNAIKWSANNKEWSKINARDLQFNPIKIDVKQDRDIATIKICNKYCLAGKSTKRGGTKRVLESINACLPEVSNFKFEKVQIKEGNQEPQKWFETSITMKVKLFEKRKL